MKPSTRKTLLIATIIALSQSTAAAPIDNGFKNNHLYQPYGNAIVPYTFSPTGTSGTTATAPLQQTGTSPPILSTGLPPPSYTSTPPQAAPYPSLNTTTTPFGFSTATTAPSPTTTGTASSDPCATVANGALVCNGESYYGLCNDGNVIWQPVANGTACVDGAITWASWYPGNPANQGTRV
ncbi:hypothetical protein EJ03DRAFT_21467 [Teratosphaeria nubilosa]|uniref:Carbohydrate-binding module family 19 domain-containing protein n=1 Tax=Teratosphaeria nubilosa TaxID=161662 RepID=A0A6G1LGG7_9PEZI|nr:hypothetical protein EJ03DRAFT_21467 [Teratosphaeria nubilosa]